MLISKLGALALILMTGACASNPGTWPKPPKEPLRGGVAEFQVTSYDGEDIKGRVLIGATIDPVVMYYYLLESSDLELVNIRACGETREVPHTIFDLVVPDPDKVITIRPGYWYGTNVLYGLFAKNIGLGPNCLEAELVVRDSSSRVVTRLPIRVVRTDKPPPPPDGGAPSAPKPPASDAGAP